jgi:formylmethanofuran dehydrogenase subunit B
MLSLQKVSNNIYYVGGFFNVNSYKRGLIFKIDFNDGCILSSPPVIM